jgi:hypothetical protein
MTRRLQRTLAAAVLALVPASSAFATTKGLNQIVTPDVQPTGQLSISYQYQDPQIGNQNEIQAELGVSKEFEVALFQGFSPPQEIFNAELGIVDKRPWLLSTGFTGWTSSGVGPQPFLEGGYYKGKEELILGAVDSEVSNDSGSGLHRELQSILGVAYQIGPRLQGQIDYQAGAGNSSTVGVTYAVTPTLSFNPAIYVSNAAPHNVLGYAVLSWSIQAWK